MVSGTHLSFFLVSWLATISQAAPVFSGSSSAPRGTKIGSAHVVNHCKSTVWLWSMGEQTGPRVQLEPGKSYTETFHSSSTIGTSIKVARVDNLFEGKPIEQLEYTVSDGKVFYDLSEINGEPFATEGAKLAPSDHSCTTVTSGNAYHNPDDVATKACQVSTDLTLHLCKK